MRGQARDYDGWARLAGDDAWTWENSLPDFMAHEDHYRLDNGADPATGANSRFSDLHGHGGEWRIEKQRLRWDILDDFATAMTEAGFERTDDFNSGDNAGIGYFEVNQKAGWRWNAAKAFLRPARARPNLTIWTEAHVERLLFETASDGGRRCVGAVVRRGGDGGHGALQRRGRAVGGRDRLAADPAAVGRRSRRASQGARRRRCARCARRRREPAGSPADPGDLQGPWRPDAEHARRQPVRQGADRTRVSAEALRADEHGAKPARRVHPLEPRAAARQSRVPRPAAEPRRLRRGPAHVPGHHRERLQPQPHQSRHRAHPIRPLRRRPDDRPELPLDTPRIG